MASSDSRKQYDFLLRTSILLVHCHLVQQIICRTPLLCVLSDELVAYRGWQAVALNAFREPRDSTRR